MNGWWCCEFQLSSYQIEQPSLCFPETVIASPFKVLIWTQRKRLIRLGCSYSVHVLYIMFDSRYDHKALVLILSEYGLHKQKGEGGTHMSSPRRKVASQQGEKYLLEIDI